jgi:hypothetical protein
MLVNFGRVAAVAVHGFLLEEFLFILLCVQKIMNVFILRNFGNIQ